MRSPLLILPLALFCTFSSAYAAEPKLKKVSHRGGVVEFYIPANWKTEAETEDEDIFYDESPGSATLRLTVITLKSPTPIKKESAVDTLRGLKVSKSRQIDSLTNGNAVLHYSEPVTESGHKLHIVYWILANSVPPDHARIATFSYTMLEDQKEQQRFKDELSLIDREVRRAAFAKELGRSKSN